MHFIPNSDPSVDGTPFGWIVSIHKMLRLHSKECLSSYAAAYTYTTTQILHIG